MLNLREKRWVDKEYAGYAEVTRAHYYHSRLRGFVRCPKQIGEIPADAEPHPYIRGEGIFD